MHHLVILTAGELCSLPGRALWRTSDGIRAAAGALERAAGFVVHEAGRQVAAGLEAVTELAVQLDALERDLGDYIDRMAEEMLS